MTKVQLLVCNNPTKYTGRIYPKEEVEREIAKHTELLGEVQPLYSQWDLTRMMNVLYKDAAFKLNNFRFEGDILFADMTILDTPAGKVIKEWNDAFYFGIRSIGNIDENYVVSDLKITTFDILVDIKY